MNHYHDHVCHICWTIFTDNNWRCTIQPHEALCPQCAREAEMAEEPMR